MAKKKSSAKKASAKKTVKKVVKKAVKKTPVKKSAPKATAKKKTAAPKKAAKKSAPKKAVAKTAKKVAKSTAKPAAKKTAKPVVKKAAAKTAAPVKQQHLVKAPTAKKLVDLSDFITPLDDRLIVQTMGAEKMTAGGLYIPDTVADVSGNLEGTVVAVGRGHFSKKGHLRPMDVQVGDKVVFSEFSGSKVKIQNEDLIILREAEVMGVLSK